jgi:hypothetical protein
MVQPSVLPKVNYMGSFDLGELTKLVSIFAAFAYAIGVVAVNTYLHELGIVDFSFAKPKLLLTGVLVLFTFLLLASPPFFLAWFLATQSGQRGRIQYPRGILISIGIFIFILIAASASLCFREAGPGLGQITVWQIWEYMRPKSNGTKFLTALLIALAVYSPIVVASVSVYVATRLFEQTKPEKPTSRISAQGFYCAVAIALVVISTIGYICIFTSTFYPAIPQEFGGGEPYYESFSVADKDRCQLQQLGIPFAPNAPNITMPLPVVHETDTLVAVWLTDPTETVKWRFAIGELDKTQISSMMAHLAEPEKAAARASVPCTN